MTERASPDRPPGKQGRSVSDVVDEDSAQAVADMGQEGLDLTDQAQDIALRRWYATWALRGVAAQVVIADIVFIVYAWAGVGWDVPAGVIQAWLAATVVQLVSVALVITKYLFPRR